MKFLPILTICLLMLAACGQNSMPDLASLPEGDFARGKTLFATSVDGAPECSSCHRLDEQIVVGPGLLGFSERAKTRVQGQSAKEYAFHSIMNPSEYIVSGFANVMYAGYSHRLNEQQLADIIEFLLSL